MLIETGRWLLDLREEYSQFLQSCSWYTFRFFQLEFEHDAELGAYEITTAFLGLGLRVRYTYDNDTEMWRELKSRIADIEGKGGADQ